MRGKGGVSINGICLLESQKESEDGKKIWVRQVLGCGLASFWLNHGFLTI